MRDKEWLKEMVDEKSEVVSSWALGRSEDWYWKNDNLKINKGLLFDLIDQLEKPEITEEQAWSKIKLENHYHIAPAYVEVYEKAIKRGIKPEYFNETEKPVIPQIVADYIKDCEEQAIHWFEAMDGIASDYHADKEDERTKKVYEWVMRNPDKFVDAFRNGYEVEKEQKYHVVNKENYFMLRKYDGLVDILYASSPMSRDEYGKDTRFMLTEKEIKDYDPRFWQFAEPVEEVTE